jgi:uncharacterized protein (DUF2384 family)
MARWTPKIDRMKVRNVAALRDVLPLLERLSKALGSNAVARFVGVHPITVTRWRNGRWPLCAEMTRRVIDLHDVFNRALQVFRPEHAVKWFVGSEPFLNGARPIDLLALRGAAPLIEALSGIEAGGIA